jgi:hypothetical protein
MCLIKHGIDETGGTTLIAVVPLLAVFELTLGLVVSLPRSPGVRLDITLVTLLFHRGGHLPARRVLRLVASIRATALTI